MAYTSVHLPVGYKVEVETTAGSGTYTDLGVTMNEGTLNFTYDAVKVTGSKAENVLNFFKNMQLEASFTLLQQELSNIHKLMSGATTYAVVAGTPVVGATQTLVANAWDYKKFYAFEHQQGAGTVPSTISAVNDGAIVADTDYYITQDEAGKWGFVVIDTVDTDKAYNLVFTYTYTPNASRTLSAGSASIDVLARSFRISKVLDTGKTWTMVIYAGVNTAGLSFSLPRYDSDEPSILECTITGQLDTTRTDLDQLFKITDEFGITDI
jgi:hypothetical protein